jgi:hypothetical protein
MVDKSPNKSPQPHLIMDEQPKTTTPKDEKHSINWGSIILWPVVILILYVLSFGPVMRFGSMVMVLRAWNNKSYIHNLAQRNGFLGKFYTPLYWAYNETPLHKPLGMYLHLWVPIAFKNNGEANN